MRFAIDGCRGCWVVLRKRARRARPVRTAFKKTDSRIQQFLTPRSRSRSDTEVEVEGVTEGDTGGTPGGTGGCGGLAAFGLSGSGVTERWEARFASRETGTFGPDLAEPKRGQIPAKPGDDGATESWTPRSSSGPAWWRSTTSISIPATTPRRSAGSRATPSWPPRAWAGRPRTLIIVPVRTEQSGGNFIVTTSLVDATENFDDHMYATLSPSAE